MARCACPTRAPSLGSLWRETRIATRKYANRPAAYESGMSIGTLGRLERRPSAKGDVWKQFHDTYPDAGNRFRTYTTRGEYGSEQSGRAKRTLGDLGDDGTDDGTDTSDGADDGSGGGSDWDASDGTTTATTTTSDAGFFSDLGEVLGAGACFKGVDANFNLCGPDVPGVAGTTPGSPVANAIQQLQAPSTAWSFLGSGGGAPASSLVSTLRLAVIGVVVVAAAVAVAEVASATKTVATVRKHT